MKEIPFFVIEHNIEFIKSADYVVELGPEGGDAGGRLLFAGTPSEMKMSEKICYGRIFMMIPDCSISIATQSPIYNYERFTETEIFTKKIEEKETNVMKLMIASDIHGSAYYCLEMLDAMKKRMSGQTVTSGRHPVSWTKK